MMSISTTGRHGLGSTDRVSQQEKNDKIARSEAVSDAVKVRHKKSGRTGSEERNGTLPVIATVEDDTKQPPSSPASSPIKKPKKKRRKQLEPPQEKEKETEKVEDGTEAVAALSSYTDEENNEKQGQKNNVETNTAEIVVATPTTLSSPASIVSDGHDTHNGQSQRKRKKQKRTLVHNSSQVADVRV